MSMDITWTEGPASDSATERPQLRMLSCDEVAWLKHALDRFEDAVNRRETAVSRGAKAAKMAAVLEIAEIMHCGFADDAAKHNVISDFPEIYQGARASEPKGKP